MHVIDTMKDVNNDKKLKVLFRGWFNIPHSYSMVNCFQIVNLYKRYKDNIEFYIEEMPYFRQEWNAVKKLVYSEEYNQIVRNFKQWSGEEIDLVVADLSFISLSLVLPALAAVSKPSADFVLMVKPQFEVGREKLGAGGVVRDPALRKAAVLDVAESAYDVGLGTMGIAASPLPGPAGNVEYFLWLRRGAPAIDEAAVDQAIAMGPA